MRLLNVAAFFFAVASALLLYALNYDTRRLESELQAKRGTLARPDRIDDLARRLGLGPPKPEQFAYGREVSELNERRGSADGR